jgi:hypothetical protein
MPESPKRVKSYNTAKTDEEHTLNSQATSQVLVNVSLHSFSSDKWFMIAYTIHLSIRSVSHSFVMSKISHISWSLHNPHNSFTHIEIHFFVRGAKKKARIKQIAGLSRDVNLPYCLNSHPSIKMKLIPIITM